MNRGSRKWLRPLKALEYYVEEHFSTFKDSEYALYHAVIEGRVRCRCAGKLFDTAQAHSLRQFQHDPEDPYALPPDIEVCVDDIVAEFRDGISEVRAPTVLFSRVPPANEIGLPTRTSPQGSKQALIQEVYASLWPEGPPVGMPKQLMYDQIRTELKQRPIRDGERMIRPTADDKTIRKALRTMR